MKKISLFILSFIIIVPAMAVSSGEQARRSMASQMVMTAPRATASTNQLAAMANLNAGAAVVDKSSIRVRADDIAKDDDNDNGNNENDDENDEALAEIERKKQACLNNNIGIGNTFVWASRYSNTDNYSSMVEDVNNPENNVCFVLVEVKSNDNRVDMSDVKSKYFQTATNITCGSWLDEEMLRQRILDAKKSGRAWATVGGVVGGAGVGVGAMEWFGNRLIGGDVMGQKAFEEGSDAQLVAQLKALRNKDGAKFNEFVTALETLKEECEGWEGGDRPAECGKYDYTSLLKSIDN